MTHIYLYAEEHGMGEPHYHMKTDLGQKRVFMRFKSRLQDLLPRGYEICARAIRKIPFIPTESEVDQLISGCSKRKSTFVQLLKETGMRSGEAWRLTYADIDTVTKTENHP